MQERSRTGCYYTVTVKNMSAIQVKPQHNTNKIAYEMSKENKQTDLRWKL